MRDKLKRLIKRHDLGKYSDIILALSGPALRLGTRRSKKVPLGATKLGGSPHVPKNFEWPSRDNRPLTFIGQVNLAEVQKYALWPRNGLLLFFYDVAKQPWGFDPKDKTGSAIIHISSKGLHAMPSPAGDASVDKGGPLNECAAEQTSILTIPPPDNPALARFLSTTDALLAYMGLCDDFYGAEKRPFHQLFGWPQVIQHDMEAECELAFNGVNCGGSDKQAESKRADLLASGAAQWQLMLQVSSDDKLGIMWGDCGRIYFYATARARANVDFAEHWTVLQCC